MHPRDIAFSLAALLVAGAAACGGSSGFPSRPTVAPTPAPSPTPAATPPPTPLPTPAADHAPKVDLRFTPPLAADDTIDVDAGDPLKINASHSVDPDGDLLFLTVAWGDGRSDHIKCGPCRLEHAYRKHGTYALRATVSDLKIDVVRTVTVFAH